MEVLILGAAVLFALVFIGFFTVVLGIYNALVASKENINKAWANIDVILKQRYDEMDCGRKTVGLVA